MTVEDDVRSTPDVLHQILTTVDVVPLRKLLGGPAVFLGSGSSYCVGMSGAALYEGTVGAPAQAVLPSEYRPRPDWLHVAISRTGQTTELIRAMSEAKASGARVLLLAGERGSPAESWADQTLALPFAAESAVVQTRFITATLLVLRLLLSEDNLDALADAVGQGLAHAPSLDRPHIVFLGRRWRHGLARSAALTVEESALVVPESHQTLDYRHGPIACADSETLIWCFDPDGDVESTDVLNEAATAGAAVHRPSGDPLVSLVQAQLAAARLAVSRGLDSSAPRNLTRAVVLPGH